MYRLNRRRKGFGVAPVLYLLGLVGVSAGVLFSDYSQSIRANIILTNATNDRNGIQTAVNFMSGAAVLGTDGLTICPPRSASASSACSNAPQNLVDISTLSSSDPRLPSGWQNAASTGSPYEVDILSGGLSQLDSAGHYLIVCRWENTTGETTQPAIKVLSAGAGGTLNTKCGDTFAGSGNLLQKLFVADLMQRASAWNLSGNTATFGAVGSKVTVDASGNLVAAGNITGAAGSFSSLTDSGAASISGLASLNGGAAITGGLSSDTMVATGSAKFGATTVSSFIDSGDATISGAVGIGRSPVGGFALFVAGWIGTNSGISGMPAGNSLALMNAGKAVFYGTAGIPEKIQVSPVFNDYTGGNATVSLNSSGDSYFTGGKVGIGTKSPNSNLEIDGTDGMNAQIRLQSYASDPNYYTDFNQAYSSSTGLTIAQHTYGKSTTTLSLFNGSVGIGTTSPAYTLDVNGTFNASGAASVASLTVSGGQTIGGALNGSTGVFTGTVTASAFIGAIALGTGGVSLSGVVAVANGGTGAATASAALLNLGVTNGSGYLVPPLPLTGVSSGVCAVPTVGTDGRVTNCGALGTIGVGSGGTGTNTAFTQGSVVFAGAAGIYSQNNPKFFWNNSTYRLGLGTATPSAALDVYGAININGQNAISFPKEDIALHSGASIAIGYGSLIKQPSLSRALAFANTAIGYMAIGSTGLTGTAGNLTAVGYAALSNNTSGTDSTAVGAGALYSNTAGNKNTAFGSYSLFAATTGNNNTVVGYRAGQDISSGSNNIIIGVSPGAGVGITTGDNNILIGYDVPPPSQTASNQLNIGNLIYSTGLASGATASTGNVGIGTNSPSATLDVNGAARLAPQASAPLTCSGTTKGSLAFAAVAGRLCECNGTSWIFDYNGAACTW